MVYLTLLQWVMAWYKAFTILLARPTAIQRQSSLLLLRDVSTVPESKGQRDMHRGSQ